tara:strand:+ start:501 stop:1667 length:1167 start_codon:yes stop_codon:yes gene_type:complete
MDNFGPLYHTESDDSDSSDNSSVIDTNTDTNIDLQTCQYRKKIFNFIIDTNDRNWFSSFYKKEEKTIKINGFDKKTFEFKIKFGDSDDILDYTNIIGKRNKLNIPKKFFNLKSLIIPLELKNITSIQIITLTLPNRLVYLGKGNYTNILNFRYLTVYSEDISNTYYGTNKNLNYTLGVLYPLSTVFPTNNIKYIEFKEKGGFNKIYNPVPLATINSLNISIKDPNGNTLNFKNDILTIKEIKIIKDKNFIKIETTEYFNQEYCNGDIIIIKNFSFSNTESNLSQTNYLKIKEFINRKQGHRIYLSDNFKDNIILNTGTLKNEFSILTDGDYNDDNFEIEQYINNNLTIKNVEGDEVFGEILNTSIQLSLLMKIETKVHDFEILNSQII